MCECMCVEGWRLDVCVYVCVVGWMCVYVCVCGGGGCVCMYVWGGGECVHVTECV